MTLTLSISYDKSLAAQTTADSNNSDSLCHCQVHYSA